MIDLGMLTFVRGLAALAGPPISGLIRDTTNSYSASFYLASGILYHLENTTDVHRI